MVTGRKAAPAARIEGLRFDGATCDAGPLLTPFFTDGRNPLLWGLLYERRVGGGDEPPPLRGLHSHRSKTIWIALSDSVDPNAV